MFREQTLNSIKRFSQSKLKPRESIVKNLCIFEIDHKPHFHILLFLTKSSPSSPSAQSPPPTTFSFSDEPHFQYHQFC